MTLIFQKRAKIAARRRPPAKPPRQDRVLADMPTWLEKAKNLPDIRLDRVTEIRLSLEKGSYCLEKRMDDLLDVLPEELIEMARLD